MQCGLVWRCRAGQYKKKVVAMKSAVQLKGSGGNAGRRIVSAHIQATHTEHTDREQNDRAVRDDCSAASPRRARVV